MRMDTAPATTSEDKQAEKIARVISVSGSQLVALLGKTASEDSAAKIAAPQIGEMIKLETRNSTVFGIVTGLNIPLPESSGEQTELRIVEIELIGEIERSADGKKTTFQRGVSSFPSLDDTIFRATLEDLQRVFIRPELNSVRIGHLHQDKSVPAFIVPDDLLGKHIAILGSTGSGKSCATAAILHAILAKHPKAHILLLDPHNEYAAAFKGQAEVISPQNLQLPYWLLNFEELKELVIGQGSRNTEADSTVLNQVVTQAKRNIQQSSQQQAGGADQGMTISIDTPIPYRLSDVGKIIDEHLGKLDKPSDSAPYLRIKEKFQQLQGDRRYSFMFPGLTVLDNMAKILSRMFRVPVDGKPITVLDTSGVPSEILNVVVSLICRMCFDFALWSDQAVPILLACEEAHRYAPSAEGTGFESSKRALSRIAKEGRKYGISLCLISQRPSELASTILSQCGTIFSLRLTSQKDQEFLAAVLPDSSIGLMGEVPSLRNGEAIAVGEGVPVPARICFDRLSEDMRPKSRTAPFSQAWTEDKIGPEFMQEVVARWRRQR
jgi:uncharacterized protein